MSVYIMQKNHRLNFDSATEMIKYAMVGCSNVIFTYILFAVFLKVIGLHYLVAASVSWFCGVIASYFFHFVWVFKPEKEFKFNGRFIRYFSISFSVYVISLFTLKFFVEKTEWDPLILQALLTPIWILCSFVLTKFWAMKIKNNIGKILQIL